MLCTQCKAETRVGRRTCTACQRADNKPRQAKIGDGLTFRERSIKEYYARMGLVYESYPRKEKE